MCPTKALSVLAMPQRQKNDTASGAASDPISASSFLTENGVSFVASGWTPPSTSQRPSPPSIHSPPGGEGDAADPVLASALSATPSRGSFSS
mmetsp:Transcript_30511/g.47199  ORF Transcript_30511/g.47199 Transcript_30511/m.47199 type:complete len:92 (+) Transcript_30511:126-401(+)